MPAPLNANELRLSTAACDTPPSGRARMPRMLGLACAKVMMDLSLWLAEMLSFNLTSLTQEERLLKKYRLSGCSGTLQNG